MAPRRWSVALAAFLLLAGCAGPSPIGPTDPRDPTNPLPPVFEPRTLVGAGDIGYCGLPGAAATGQLLDGIDGTVFTAGDNAYMTGSAADFANCYDPFWGRFRPRTFPTPGNHEYQSPGAAPYFAYFGERAGPPGLGYYSYNLGAWHVIALNSNIPMNEGSAQFAWLRTDLTSNRRTCMAAYWHHPLYSSGRNGPQPHARDVWRLLYEFGVDVVLNGHDHLYERFAPQTPDGRRDDERGIRQFTVGTGGAPLYAFRATLPNSEARASVWGVLRLTLRADDYLWQFVPIAGEFFSDSGFGRCH